MSADVLVIPGEWRRSPLGKWDFIVDKDMMSRVVHISVSNTLAQVEKDVRTEFFGDTSEKTALSLSYWPPNSKELPTGLTTPPVLIKNVRGIVYFFRHLQVHKTMNLFVSFPSPTTSKGDSDIQDKSCGFNTPAPPPKQDSVFLRRSASPAPAASDGPLKTAASPSTAASKAPPFFLDDEEIINHVELEEERIRSENRHAKDTWLSDAEEDDESEDGRTREIDNDEVRPRGYDYDFWRPLLEDDYAGSNAADIMCGLNGPNITPVKVVTCSTNDAFDHLVASGDVQTNQTKKEDIPTPYGGGKHGKQSNPHHP